MPSPGVQAQDKPPLKILVGFPPGGSADVLARMVADALRDDFSPIVVDNKPGAGGRIALQAVKVAKPDGQTVIVLPSGSIVVVRLPKRSYWLLVVATLSLPVAAWKKECPQTLAARPH